MAKTTVLAAVLALSSAALANYPFQPNVKAADYGDSMDLGETAMGLWQQNLFMCCNSAQRSTYPVQPYGRSTDGGATWLPTLGFQDLSRGTWHTDPAMVYDPQGRVHMVVQFSTTVTTHYLSTDNGNTWCDTADITDRSTGGGVDKDWMIYDAGNLYVTWQEMSGPQTGIRFAKSTDGGASWTRATIVPGGSGITTLATDYNHVIYLVYGWNNLYFTKSTDYGATWTSPLFLNSVTYSTGYGDRAPMPCIAVPANGVIFLAWTDDRSGNWDVLYRRSSDGGANWSSIATLNDSTVGGQFKVWLCSDPYGGLHAFYYHTPSWPTSNTSRLSMRYNYSPDGGATIYPSIRMTDTTFTSRNTFLGEYHNIVCDSQRIYAEWADGREGHNTLYFTSALLSQLSVEDNYRLPPARPEVSLSLPAVFVRSARLDVSLARSQDVRLAVYDASGRQVRKLHQGRLAAGQTSFRLDGLPLNRPLFLRLTGDQPQTLKFTVLP
jgi:hypothetical protein